MLRASGAAALLLAGAGLVPGTARAFNKAAFEARSMAEALRVLGSGAPAESKDVTLTAPDIAENGASVSVTFGSSLPNVRQLVLFVDKNPVPLVARFNVSDAVDPVFTTRIKVAESSDVYAVAITADGKAWFARRDVKVTLSGCAA